MLKTAVKPKWIAALVFALAVAAVLVLLSQWQLSRSLEKDVAPPSVTEKVQPFLETIDPGEPMLGNIENPVTGERVRWLQSTPDLLRAEWRITAGGHALDLHRHPHSEERIEVLAGVLGLELHGEPVTLHPGDTVTIPAGSSSGRPFNDAT